MPEFFLDENVLGVAYYLRDHVKYRKIGDDNCPSKGAKDLEIIQFTIDNDLILVTKDRKMIQLCNNEQAEYITIEDIDIADKITNYTTNYTTNYATNYTTNYTT